jgi:MFS-type transporter involved in bile tolerance (Atg22 family)
VERRVCELKKQKRQRRYLSFCLYALTACFAVIVGVGIVMPSIVQRLSVSEYINNGMMASIFYEGSSISYIIVGLLAFGLGVCFTVLCYLQNPVRKKR